MSPGQFARRLLGRHFHIAGDIYRRIFVDMDKVTDAMMPHIPRGAHVLDVGGGDGYVVDLLLAKRPDIRVTMTDIAPAIGSFISAVNRDRVTLLPGTDVATVEGRFDVITLADVVHHVPVDHRPGFLAALAEAAIRTGATKVVIKDVQPGGLRSRLALWGDLYITGDKGVAFLQPEALDVPGFARVEQVMPDHPNYCVTFQGPETQP